MAAARRVMNDKRKHGAYMLAASALAAAGWGLGDIRSANAADYPIDQTFGMYSYGDSSCNNIVDPISIVFTHGNGAHNHVFEHAKRGDHGEWEEKGGGQYFYDNYGCSSSDDSAASNNGYLRDRYHMRYEAAFTTNGGHAYASTPHFDDFDAGYATHCVRPDGFTKGRTDIYENWLMSPSQVPQEHNSWFWSYWGNTVAIHKCGDYTRNDGWVIYLDMRGVDAY
jgi:hypothetical protein